MLKTARFFRSKDLRLRTRDICTSFLLLKERKNQQLDYLNDIRKEIEDNNKKLRHTPFSHIKSRGVISKNNNLRLAMQCVQQKLGTATNAVANIPSFVTIEIVGNGTTQMRQCVAIRTPLKIYLFNCPEGTSRFLSQIRMKSTNVNDIFITNANWDNISGISSILLSKETAAPTARIHGSVNVKHFLECIRPFNDADYGSAKYPTQVDERPYTLGSYEDAGLKVTYMPLVTDIDSKNVCVAYYVELKAPARRIDASKLIALKVPKGPLIGQLKNGETVTLPNGSIVNPEDVYVDSISNDDKGTVLIVECLNNKDVEMLSSQSLIESIKTGKKTLNYMVHLCPDNIFNSPRYRELIESLGDSCQHIVVNEKGPLVPGVESIFRNHKLLHKMCPSVFPPLHPTWSGVITQTNELQRKEGDITYAAPIQRFTMRKGGNDEPIVLDLKDSGIVVSPAAETLIAQLEKEQQKLPLTDEYPKLSFLGTSSAVPSKYRNVTGYLMETSPNAAVMVDTGEGSYGQIKVLMGEEKTKQILMNLKAVFITHAHQDHMTGLYTIVKRREEAYQCAGVPYKPLVLVTTRNVLKPLKTYSMCFESLEHLLHIVDMTRFPLTPPSSPPGPANKRRRLPSPVFDATRDVIPELPRPLFDEKEWNIQECKTVHVHHTRMANGFVFRANQKRIVFSGDTKPCDLLVSEGMGADVLIHEATFEDGHEADALRKKHSTMGQAVDVGKRMKAKHIILTHFSARYPKVPDLPSYLDECGNVSVAMDNLSVRFDHLPLVPKLIPVFREVYQEELFEIELRKEQRNLKAKEANEMKAQEHLIKA
ncbi:unnamed protein product [Auanema sp. JU1783]|nr:unnamed protein product [Auanema sp. JU1783]